MVPHHFYGTLALFPASHPVYINLRLFILILLCVSALPTRGDVTVNGVNSEVEKNVLQLMTLSTFPCSTRTSEIRRLYRLAIPQVRRAMEPFGYYNAVISENLVFEEDCWKASFDIVPGEPVKIRQVDIQAELTGPDQVQVTKFIQAKAPRVGDTMLHLPYEAFREQLRRTLLDLGFLDARYAEQRVTIDTNALTADIRLLIDTGQKYQLGEVRYEMDFLNSSLVSRFLTLSEGDDANRRLMGTTQQELMQSGYFREVEIITTAQPESATLDVTIRGSANTLRDRSVGAGISTDKGIFATAAYSRTLLNSLGHQFKAQVEASPQSELFDLQAEYRIPGTQPIRDWRSVYLGANAQNGNDAIDARTYNAGIRGSRSSGLWRLEPFIDVTFERTDRGEANDDNIATAPGWRAIYRNVSGGNHPTGLKARFEFAAASDDLFSDASFFRVSAQTKWIQSMGSRARMILRGEAGYLATDQFNEIPTNWRFFAGGDTTVRGFDFRSLGPRNSNGDTIGGEWIAVASAELDYRFLDKWLASAFIDTGDVGFDGTRTEQWPIAAGMGVGWISPLGPVRVAIAFPIQGSDEDYRLHISLGPDL